MDSVFPTTKLLEDAKRERNSRLVATPGGCEERTEQSARRHSWRMRRENGTVGLSPLLEDAKRERNSRLVATPGGCEERTEQSACRHSAM